MTLDDYNDRFEIKVLIDAYAYCADRKDPERYATLYVEDARIEIFQGEPAGAQPIAVLEGRDQIVQGFHDHLMPYELTQHFICQSTVELAGDQATGETYTMAHNIWTEDGQRTLMVIGVRYGDVLTRRDGRWLFQSRRLALLWSDKKAI